MTIEENQVEEFNSVAYHQEPNRNSEYFRLQEVLKLHAERRQEGREKDNIPSSPSHRISETVLLQRSKFANKVLARDRTARSRESI